MSGTNSRKPSTEAGNNSDLDVSYRNDEDLITCDSIRPRRNVKIPDRFTDKPARQRKTYQEKMRLRLASCQNGQPVVVRECELRRVMRHIANNGKKSSPRRLHPVVNMFGDVGARCLTECDSPSVEIICPDHKLPIRYGLTYSYLMAAMRRAMLNHDWTYCLRLFDTFIRYEMTNSRYFVYRLRVMLLLIFHLKLNEERLDKFLRLIMLVHDVNERAKLLKSFHTLKKLRHGSTVVARLNRRLIAKSIDKGVV